ncbi:MAG: hypothetical protein L0Z48_11975 [candidate division Zixibacteria bacterium]|nr:hypothetical protein [candidate division Zixibacteria bacterium]
MKKLICTTAVFLIVLAPAWMAAKTTKKPARPGKTDIENPISKMIFALGGEKFLTLSGVQISGRGTLVGKNPVKIEFAQEGEKLRSQIETNFWSSTEVFDGASSWRRFGSEKPFKLTQSPLQLFAQNGLSRLQKIGNEYSEIGRDTLIDKTRCFWVKSFDSAAGELWIFIDESTYRPKELYSPANGITAALAAYEPVEGIYFPRLITVRRGAQNYLELQLDTVAVNPPLPPSFFAFPEE